MRSTVVIVGGGVAGCATGLYLASLFANLTSKHSVYASQATTLKLISSDCNSTAELDIVLINEENKSLSARWPLGHCVTPKTLTHLRHLQLRDAFNASPEVVLILVHESRLTLRSASTPVRVLG
jgi:hypothetical protein